MKKTYKIVGVEMTHRSAWATRKTDLGEEIRYEVAQKGYLLLQLTLQDVAGIQLQVPIDLLYSLSEEGESLLANRGIEKAVEAIAFKFLGYEIPEEDIFEIRGGSGYRLSAILTKKVRKNLIGFDEVPLSYQYSHRLAANYQRKKEEGRLPKKSTFKKLIENPLIRIGEWKRAMMSHI